jgi:hypothetical protein
MDGRDGTIGETYGCGQAANGAERDVEGDATGLGDGGEHAANGADRGIECAYAKEPARS